MSLSSMKTAVIDPPLFEILAMPAKRGSVRLFWLGQAGFAIRSSSSLILIDAYISDFLAEKYKDALFKHKRLMPPPLVPEELRGVDFIFASHAHSDHLDPGSISTLMALNPDSRLILPRSAVPKALERGADPDRLVPMPIFKKQCLCPLMVEMIPSAHENLDKDKNGDCLFGGFIIELEGLKIYHSGDCIPYDGLAATLRERQIDLALLPVNGRDAFRQENGVPGNFSVDEAAWLCLEAGIPALIPHHFGMFEFNTVRPETIKAALDSYKPQGLDYCIPDTNTYLIAHATNAVYADRK